MAGEARGPHFLGSHWRGLQPSIEGKAAVLAAAHFKKHSGTGHCVVFATGHSTLTLTPSPQDPVPAVREALCWLLACWSDFLRPDILRFHDSILPAVFELLKDRSSYVMAKG